MPQSIIRSEPLPTDWESLLARPAAPPASGVVRSEPLPTDWATLIGDATPGPSLADAAAVPVPDVLTPRGDIELPVEAAPMQGPMPMARIGPSVAPVAESGPMPLASALVPGRRLSPGQQPAAGFPSKGTLADLARGATGELPLTDYYTEVTAPAPPGSRAGDIAANVGKAGVSGLLAATTTQPWSAVEMSLDALGLREAASWAAQVRKDSQETRESLRAGQVGAGPTERAIYSGIESIGAMVPSIVATILTKNPSVGLGMMGVGTGTEKYAELKETAPHMTPVGRFLAGVVEGSAEVLTEKIPLDNLMGDLVGGSGVWQTIRRQVMAEVPGEQVATFTQDANEWAAVNPGKPVAAFLAERPGRGYETLVSTLVATVGMSAGSIALDRGLHKLSTADVVSEGAGGDAAFRTVQEAIDRAMAENATPRGTITPGVVGTSSSLPRDTSGSNAPPFDSPRIGSESTVASTDSISLPPAPSPVATDTPSVVAPPSAPEDPAPVAAGSPILPRAQPAPVRLSEPPAQPEIGVRYEVPARQLKTAPGTLQYRGVVNAEGVEAERAITTPYDPLKGGVLAVWQDPKDGETYVVNGHHRLSAAKRDDGTVAIVYIKAPTAKEARAYGAVINLQEDNTNLRDAVQYMVDTNLKTDGLEAAGISPRAKISRQAAAIAELEPHVRRQWEDGTLPDDIAAAIGAAKLEVAQQEAAVDFYKGQDARGHAPTVAVMARALDRIKDAPTVEEDDGGQPDIFGNKQTKNVFADRMDLEVYVLKELGKDKSRLRAAIREKDRLARANTKVDVDAAKAIADESARAQAVLNSLMRSKGPISDILNQAATELAEGGDREAIRTRVLADVVVAAEAELGRAGAVDRGRPPQGAGGNAPTLPGAVPERAPARSKAEPAPAEEDVAPEPRKFSSTQVNLPSDVASRVRALASTIPDADLAEDGREADPHITVQYGIDSDDAAPLREALAKEAPIVATLGKTSLFENEDADVVKVDIDSPDLRRVRAAIAKVVDTPGDTHPTYIPHATIAYVKPGKGKAYAGKTDLDGQTITIDRIVFSTRDNQTIEIPLAGEKPRSGPPPGDKQAARAKKTREVMPDPMADVEDESDTADLPRSGEPVAFTAENLATIFGLNAEQAAGVIALAEAMDLDLGKIQIVLGGEPGSGALPQDLSRDENFARWRGRSVVDSIVYHSTPYEFTEFDFSDAIGPHFGTKSAALDRGLKTGANIRDVTVEKMPPDVGTGWEVWIDGDLHSEHATKGEADKVAKTNRKREPMAVWLKIERPLRTPDMGTWGFGAMLSYLQDHKLMTAKESDAVWAQWQKRDSDGWNALRDHLESRGYDGIVYQNDVEDAGSTSYVVFRPEQVKSATGNRGTFDPASPNILYQDDQFQELRQDLARAQRELASLQAERDREFDGWKTETLYRGGLLNTSQSQEWNPSSDQQQRVRNIRDKEWKAERRIKSLERQLRQAEADAGAKAVVRRGQTSVLFQDDQRSMFDEDVLPTGERQPRLPEAGFVRDVEIPTPREDLPLGEFRLTAPESKPKRAKQASLFYDGEPLFQPAYHGSPHIFEEFSLHKIGTGEGAQAYGWGLYFAGDKAVAEYYRKNLSRGPVITVNGQPLHDLDSFFAAHVRNIVNDVGQGSTWALAKKAALDDLRWRRDHARTTIGKPTTSASFRADLEEEIAGVEDAIARIEPLDQSSVDATAGGRVYKVDIPEDEDYLDYDKPLSQQSEKVRQVLESSTHPRIQWWRDNWKKSGAWDHVHGKSLYDTIASDMKYHGGADNKYRAASEVFASLGIAGIRYLDGSSRTKGTGTYNYVVFDDKLVKILEFEQQSGQGAKASVEFLQAGEALMRALTDPDVSSPVHELAHIARRWLLNRDIPAEHRRGISDEDIATAEQWAGAKDGLWDTTAEEKFARGFERYLRDGGPALPSKIRAIFSKFAAWLTDIYQSLTGSALDVEITPAMRQVFDRLVTRKERNAQEAKADAEGDVNTDSWREWAANAARVAADPEAASPKDLRRAAGYLSHKLLSLRRQAEKAGKTLDKDVAAGINNEQEWYTRLANEKEAAARKPKRSAPGGHASVASDETTFPVTTGTAPRTERRRSLLDPEPEPAPLAPTGPKALDATRAVELPELVALARDLIAIPQVVKRFRKDGKLGDFSPRGGRIRILADLFKQGNEQQLAKTLAHEIGHLVDWLPDYTLKRGNVLGHLKSLSGFLQHTFTAQDGSTVHRDDVRKELIAVSKLWRGDFNEKGKASYDRYRSKATELYADAISALLNNPGWLEQQAPVFYAQFFDHLDRKPDVQSAYFGLQELLSGTREELIARREANVDRMLFGADAKAIDVERLRRAEREKGDQHYWLRFRVQHVDKNTALIDRVKALEKKGITIPEEDDPRYLLEERSYMGGKQKAFLERFIQPLHVALREAGIDWMTFGKALFYERIIAGDRSEMANPLGLAPDSARELYAKLQQGLSAEQMTALGQAIAGFRAVVKGVAEDAYDAGLYRDDLYEQMQKNPAYVAFRVVDYMERDMTSTVHHQIGTLKDIQNPADATVLKMLVTMRAAEYNRMKVASFDLLGQHFPAEIQDAKHVWNGKGIVPVEPDDPKTQVLVTYREKGRLRGKYVDPYVAASLNNESVGRNWAAVEALRWINGKLFRPAFTGLNLGFQTFNFSRDFWRFWKNMPEMSVGRALTLYRKAGTLARVRAYGLKPNATAKQRQAYADLVEAEGAGILSLTFNDIIAGRQTEDTQIEELYAQHGIGGTPTPHRGPLKAVYAIAEWIKNTGDFIETLPKAAAIYQFQGDGAIGDISAADRSFIRRKVGSPDFLAGGTYKPITNEVLLFSNAILQAWRADFEVATDPKTASGFWWKTAMVNVAPKLAIAAFLASALGMGDDDEDDDATAAGLKQLRRALEGISEYDLTNYLSLPLGIDSRGNTVYVRMPQDDSGRLIGGLVWKALHLAQGDVETAKTLGQVFDYMAGQAPGVTPIIQAVGDVATFASGRNPYDPFRNRFLFTEDEMKAGGLPALRKFIGYEFQQFGGSILWKFYPGEDVRPRERTTTQKILELPIVSTVAGRWIKVSSFGHVEKLRGVQAGVQRDEARARAKERSAVADALRTFQKEPPPNRTRATQARLAKEVVNTLYADASPKEREAQYRDVLKKIRMGAARGQSDPIVDTVMSATSTAQRVAIVREAFNGRPAEMERWVRQAVGEQVISKQAAAAIMRAEP